MTETKEENESKFVRNCPICEKELSYTSLSKLKRAMSADSLCSSCAKTGNKNPGFDKTGINNPLFGISRPDMLSDNNVAKNTEIRKKISEKNIGRIGSMTGKKHKQESKDKSRISNTGLKRTAETRDNIRRATMKQMESGKSNNPYCRKLPYKNTNLHYQGTYELDFLDRYYDFIKIENGKTFYYFDNKNNKRAYISDFYLPDFNLIVEIKSSWTYNNNLIINETKKTAVLDSNINFIFIIDKCYLIFDKTYNLE